MLLVNIIGWIATISTTTRLFPQLYVSITTKKTKDLSLIMTILVMSQCIVWMSYSILDNYNMPLLVCDAICFLQYFYLFMAKIYYDKLFCFKKSTIENTSNLEV